MSESKNYKATVFIPTYNGEKYIADILNGLYAQTTDFSFEILIIDSGSKDKTIEIIESYKATFGDDLKLHNIDNSEFGHGRTRNLAAKMAKGEIIVYLSHDAIPANAYWLYEMVNAFSYNEKIVAVLGKQVPRPNCFPMMKREINLVFNNLGNDLGITLYNKNDFNYDPNYFDFLSFYSDVNSATRRDFLLKEISYRDVQYAEDQYFGQDIISAGYIKAYCSKGIVEHSNDIDLKDYSYRMFDEYLGLRKAGKNITLPSRSVIIKSSIKEIMADAKLIIKDPHYSKKRKIYWLFVNPMYYFAKWKGIRKAVNFDLNNVEDIAKYSLEERLKVINNSK